MPSFKDGIFFFVYFDKLVLIQYKPIMRLSNKLLAVISLISFAVILIRCSGGTKTKQSGASANTEDISKGEVAAAQYCQSCHQLPAPSLLDKVTWRDHVLPVMGRYMGIKSEIERSQVVDPESDASYLPNTPQIDSTHWVQIIAYYVSKAPERLPVQKIAEPIHQLPVFKIQPTTQWDSIHAMASYVKIDNSVSPHRIIVADGLNNRLITLNDKGETMSASVLGGTVVNMLFQQDKITTTFIGKNLWANNFKNGFVKEIKIAAHGKITEAPQPEYYQLGRPLSTDIVDLNNDGKKDYLIAQFGKMAGRLSWVERPNGQIQEHVLRDKPGCLKTIIAYNSKTKSQDIWALFAQGDEGIFFYANDGKGNFTERKVLGFPPSYGSSSFDLVDFNGDGFKDIIYTCGDNGDFSQILKPYHGVYIYLNDGKDNFTQKYFYPINGCYKAIARDFDGDGDLDIAAISEFPGTVKPWQAFVYLENKGGFNFQAYTLPLDTPFSNGMTMDAGDIDGDGRIDLLLGNGYSNGNNNSQKQPLFMILKNISTPIAK
ncbi:FG-GAP repeat domain-containing protein [Mucilaginibacter ximonensis]|uniref:FG-GAP repeat domain-containing protein n=1 Tax=Mucilaginibacter ximonensis TaxID=538021 RepID=A0ABW5YE72_9SPHI